MNPQTQILIRETLERKAEEYLLADAEGRRQIDKHIKTYLDSYTSYPLGTEADKEIVKSLRIYYEIRKGD